jgi:methionine synthase II (cobalamin-independent)
MFEEGFKRFNNVTILKVFSKTCEHDASITYLTTDEKQPRFALVREPELESYTTMSMELKGPISHLPNPDGKYDEFTEEVLEQFATALRDNSKINLVIAVLKKGRNTEFVAKAEFL